MVNKERWFVEIFLCCKLRVRDCSLSVINTFPLWSHGATHVQCQYQWTDSDIEQKYGSVWCQSRYDVTDKNNDVRFTNTCLIARPSKLAVIRTVFLTVIIAVNLFLTPSEQFVFSEN